MTPTRPYFIRALHEWLEDNDLTAYLMVDATHPDLHAPTEYAQDGRLVLAASYQATKDLHIDNDAISFAARFNGVSQDIWIPMAAVLGIYAKEDPSRALFFDPSEYADVDAASEPQTDSSDEPQDDKDDKPKRSHLKFV
ncbi:ClpXP protease specificity-enhancing factor [Moraxella caviae]|uniref:ClpXP protease specificity-enhancing factor n=1 Tax=Moraxella caviae TaxID=34060 RepID=A0A1T0A5Y0_9GAMM|nr:ClpXP protease specificity-enhancing factor [Moraxella caviae]OOR91080.1 ClpXP protease specificity-enhancing factor [Moraxella caviae]STZ14225.1 Stringent starvation protein B homolog [Moraxella caviae]VEW13161.1 Stringent starvation protein B homolog [Moraxella caviae]